MGDSSSAVVAEKTVEITVDDAKRTPVISKTLPGWYPPLLFAILAIIFYLVLVTFNTLPTQLQRTDEVSNPGRFTGQRAQEITERLVSLGPKVTSSDVNQQQAVAVLQDEVRRITQTAAAAHRIEMDVQTGSGNLTIFGMTSMYLNLKNFVVRLSPVGSQPANSLLINTHFDSVPVSPGGADATTMVSVMMEILRVLSSANTTFAHSIVFLFNGAEENGLAGSHLFITQHKWAAAIRAYINLDSAGSGGREMLFQASPNQPWLMDYYAKTSVHPFATVMAQEMFQANLIPSDTDFRIFRDYGNIVGLDFATSKHGYVYHTKFDSSDIIPPGTYQNIGDNILALTKSLANAAELNDPRGQKSGNYIFFDFVGWYFISYTTTQASIINYTVSAAVVLAVLLSLRSFAKAADISYCSISVHFIVIFIVQALSLGLGIGANLTVASTYNTYHKSMSWYSSLWLVFFNYLCPLAIGLAIGPTVYLTISERAVAKKKVKFDEPALNRSQHLQMFLHAHAIILSILLILLTVYGIQSAYVILVSLVFYAITALLNLITKLQLRDRSWVLIHLIGQLLPYLLYAYTCTIMAYHFFAIQGRSGPNANPETMIAYVSIIFGTLLIGFLVPAFLLYKRAWQIVTAFAVLFVVGIILMLTSVGFPYREKTSAQRQWIFHTERTFHQFQNGTFSGPIRSSDSGYFMLAMDRHNLEYLTNVPNISHAVDTGTFCGTEIFCGVPFYTPRMFGQASGSHWLPAEKPYYAQRANLKLQRTTKLSGSNVKRFQFQLTGPDHMAIFLSAVQSAKVVGWSFSNKPVASTLPLNGRPTYFVFLAYAESNPTIEFTIDVEYTAADWTAYSLDISVIGHYVHYDETQTSRFKEFLASFPSYVHVTPWMSTLEGYRC